MFFVFISAVFLTVSFQRVTCQRCNISDENLALKYRYGQLKPERYPYGIPARQSCVWKLPNEKHPGKALFIFVSDIDMTVNNDPIGALTIGEDRTFVQKPRANCRLYGKNITEIDLQLMNEYVMTKYVPKGRSCDAWNIDYRPAETVVFRSFGEKEVDFFPQKKFMLIYEYIETQREGSTTVHSTEKSSFITVAPRSAHIPRTSTPASTTTAQGENSDKLGQNGSNFGCIVIIVLLVILLLCVCLLLAVVLVRNRRLSKNSKMYPRVTVTNGRGTIDTIVSTGNAAEPRKVESVFGGNSNTLYDRSTEHAYSYAGSSNEHVIENQDNMINPYATVGNLPGQENGQTSPTNPVLMYDVPTNNRERAPTAISAMSTASEPYYQVPSGRTIEEQREIPGNVKDVYAVVQKARK